MNMIRQGALRLSNEDYRREKIEFSISPALGKQTAVSMKARSMAALFRQDSGYISTAREAGCNQAHKNKS